MTAKRTESTAKKTDAGKDPIDSARAVFDEEITQLGAVRDRLGAEIVAAVDAISGCSGRLIVSGVGKSGVIAKKIAGTLTSTGTPSVYMHAVDAAHGDLGVVGDDDVVLFVSKSGMGEELRQLIPPLKKLGVTIIGLTGGRDSYLAQHSDIVLDVHVPREAGSLGLAPTTSATASLVMGHVLASALIERNGFTAEDFARFHPSGILGKRLTLTVAELMRTGNDMPIVHEDTSLRDALFEIMDKSIGCTGVVDGDGMLTGIITDGDLKRILARHEDAMSTTVSTVMTPNPKTVPKTMLAADALSAMELNKPGPLLMYFVVDDAGRPIGLLHIHDILHAGLRAD